MTDDDRPFGWGECSLCGEDCELSDYNPQTRQSLHPDCAKYLSNYEPGDADGEAFRGGEAQAYARDQQLVHVRQRR